MVRELLRIVLVMVCVLDVILLGIEGCVVLFM